MKYYEEITQVLSNLEYPTNKKTLVDVVAGFLSRMIVARELKPEEVNPDLRVVKAMPDVEYTNFNRVKEELAKAELRAEEPPKDVDMPVEKPVAKPKRGGKKSKKVAK